MKKFFLMLFLFAIPFQFVYAQDLIFSIEQSEYYFLVGEDAILPINIENSYGKQISGILQYTITQQINQGNTKFSTSNTNANSFVIPEGSQMISLNLGTSNTPSTLVLNLSFNYEGGNREVSLGPITIHFVSDDSQKNNKSNPMQSSSQESKPSQQLDPFSQQRQQMQQRLDDLFRNKQSLLQDPQQRLQNNQLAQNSDALKQQIQNQLQQQEQIQREFEKQLSSNLEFMNQHNQLLQNGYNVTGGNLNPISNRTGSFEIKYQNQEGKWATLKGQMNNGTLSELEKQTQEQQELLLEKLEQNSQFQEYNKKLTEEGFSQDSMEFQNNKNQTNITIQFKNQEGDKASITAVFENEEIQTITLNDNTSKYPDLLLIAFLIAILITIIILYFIYKKFSKKQINVSDHKPTVLHTQPFDYISESKKLIAKSQNYYANKEYKDAFAAAGQAIRLFLRYEIGLKKELTNDELVQHIQNSNFPVDEIKECLGISNLVEFAKSPAREDDYKKIISLFERLLNNKKP